MKAKNWLQKLRQNEGKILLIIVGILIAYPFLRLTVYATFNLPDDADDAMVLVKKYDSAIFCELPWSFPVPLPGDSTQKKQDWCYNKAKNYFDDVTLCNKIENSWLRGMCRSSHVPCKDIENEDARHSCYRDNAESGKYGTEECEAEERHDSKATCFVGIALRTNEVQYCDAIPQESGYKSHCYSVLAKRLEAAAYCERILDDLNKERCLRNFE